MKYELYKQMPTFPATGIGPTGLDTLVLTPLSGYVNRIKSVYIDLPSGVTLNVNLSTLGTGQDDINSPGNEAGSIVFRTGLEFNKDTTLAVSGPAGTSYSVKVVTEVESTAVTYTGSWLFLAGVAGLAIGSIIARRKKGT